MVKNKGGRPPHLPSEKTRQEVSALTAYGIRQEEIAKLLNIAEKTMRKHYKNEIEIGSTIANAKVAESLFSMATKGKNVAAAIFWAKARMGWSEKVQHEHTGKDGNPIEIVNGTLDELKRKVDRLAAEGEEGSVLEKPD